MTQRPHRLTLFPYTTSSDLIFVMIGQNIIPESYHPIADLLPEPRLKEFLDGLERGSGRRDRKSTRLNSSHLGTSYAVFCSKKKMYRQIFTAVSIRLIASASP